MSKNFIRIQQTDKNSKTAIFEIAYNIYNFDEFINTHINAFIELNDIIVEYQADERVSYVGADIEFNNNKVDISYTVGSDKSAEVIRNFVFEFEEMIKKYFPSVKRIYNTQYRKYVFFGRQFFNEKEGNDV